MSDKQNDGGPAHPVVGTVGPIGRIEATGISIRDYFAGQALPQAIAHELLLQAATIDPQHFRYAAVAHAAYVMADAMMTERAKA